MGNSGGALVDARGRLVGINCAIISPSRGNIGIGFAVPINLAASVMTSLVATGKVTRGYLGVGTQTVTSDLGDQLGLSKDAKGVVVTDIFPDSPAEKAGLKSSDVVLEANGKPIASTEELRLMIAEMMPGSKIAIKIVRNGQPSVITVTLGTLAEKPNELIAGVNISRITPELRRKLAIDPRVDGLLITDVDKDSPYADRLAPNMVVMEINRAPVLALAAAKAVLIQPGRNLFKIYYQGGAGYLVVTLK
jgi:serine protease Do/serine protease DegQ